MAYHNGTDSARHQFLPIPSFWNDAFHLPCLCLTDVTHLYKNIQADLKIRRFIFYIYVSDTST